MKEFTLGRYMQNMMAYNISCGLSEKCTCVFSIHHDMSSFFTAYTLQDNFLKQETIYFKSGTLVYGWMCGPEQRDIIQFTFQNTFKSLVNNVFI